MRRSLECLAKDAGLGKQVRATRLRSLGRKHIWRPLSGLQAFCSFVPIRSGLNAPYADLKSKFGSSGRGVEPNECRQRMVHALVKLAPTRRTRIGGQGYAYCNRDFGRTVAADDGDLPQVRELRNCHAIRHRLVPPGIKALRRTPLQKNSRAYCLPSSQGPPPPGGPQAANIASDQSGPNHRDTARRGWCESHLHAHQLKEQRLAGC